MGNHPLTAGLHREIPISKALGVAIVSASELETKLMAPFAPNSNHNGTAFGGSIHSLAVLACWILVSETLKAHTYSSEYIVIQNSEIEYLSPAKSEMTATARWPNDRARAKFLEGLQRKGLARATIEASVESDGEIRATLKGRFVARTSP